MENKYWLSDSDFNFIYNKVPRLNVDLVIRKEGGIVLVQRAIEPCLGYWHLPGGTVYKNETIKDASIRIAKNETGLDVDFIKCLSYIEFLNEDRKHINMHTISLAVEVLAIGGDLLHDKNAKDIKIVFNENNVTPTVNEHLQFFKQQNIFNN
ncbi:NUDIX domain-containing protein [Candidatus Gracilibacteria bacterium]|nr:NUDIX domain-containing protein [Candidatus Gracilibacteria bacterium]